MVYTIHMQMEKEAMISGFKKTRGSILFLLAAPRKPKRLSESGTLGSSTSDVLEVLEKSLEDETGESSENKENLKSSVLTMINTGKN